MDDEFVTVEVRLTRKNRDALTYEAGMSGDQEVDVVNRAIGFYVQLRDIAREPGTHIAILKGCEVDRSGGRTRVRTLPGWTLELFTGLGPEDDPATLNPPPG